MTIIEDFDDGNLDGYASQNASVTEAAAHDGSHGLDITGAGNPDGAVDAGISTSQDNVYNFWAQSNEQSSAQHFGIKLFCGSEAVDADGYIFGLDKQDDEVLLWKYDGGNITVLAQTSATVSTGTWYNFEATAESDGSLETKLLSDDNSNEITASATDTTFSSGGLGFVQHNFGGNADTAYFDTVDETALGGTTETDTAVITSASASPITATETATATDAATRTTASASPSASTSTATATDGATVTTAAASPQAATETATATDTATRTASTASPQTATETTSATDTATRTTATATVLTSSEFTGTVAAPPSGEPNVAVTRVAGQTEATTRTEGQTKAETRVQGDTKAAGQDTD